MRMTKPSINPVYSIETQEVIQKLKEAGYSEIVDCLLDNEKDCYTKKGRLNKSSTCRKLNWKGKKLEDALQQMRIILASEYDLDVENIQDLEEEEEE
ncbi:MAG: hypothetical protein ABFD50_16035 [Smithella sp.]